MRAKGPKADLALIVADGDAVVAGVFTTNVMAAAPVTYCREVLARTDTVRAVRALDLYACCAPAFTCLGPGSLHLAATRALSD